MRQLACAVCASKYALTVAATASSSLASNTGSLSLSWRLFDFGGRAAGIKHIIRSIGAAFPDVHITVHDMVQEPGKIGVRAEISGTHLGELFGIAPTGKKVSFRLHEFHTIANGLVTTTWHMEDWFGLFMQLGQFPPQG